MGLKSRTGQIDYDDGHVEQARFYYADDEPAPQYERLDPERHVTWTQDDGTIGIRRGTAVSVGASPTYSKGYDAIDWN
jgi:hypothetical protein